jgi:ribokinase
MIHQQPKIFVVGSFVVGLTIRVSRMPVLGEVVIGDEFDMGPGGKGTNQAIAAARLGAEVSLLACVGDDLFSTFADQVFDKEGIAKDHIHHIPGNSTGIGVSQLIPSGENWIVGHLGANLCMRLEHVEAAEEKIAASDIVLVQYEVPLPVVQRALELGRKYGCRNVCNPAPAQPVNNNLLELVDVLTPNETELRILLDLPPDDPTPHDILARRIFEMGAGSVVATLGDQGALLVSADGVETLPAVHGISVVDVTGAGDSFNAALAVGLGRGLRLQDSVAEAMYAGAYTVQHLGVIKGLPTRTQLERFQQTHAT